MENDSPVDFAKQKRSLKNYIFHVLRWCRLVLTSITVEPVVFLHALAGSISMVVTSNLMKDRICSHFFGYSAEQCRLYGTGANKTVDLDVEKEWVTFDMYSTLVHTIPSVTMSLFLGSWSDLFGRRVPLMFSFTGLILSTAGNLVLFSYPSLPLWMLFVPNFLSSITGGMTTLFMSVYAYIADVSESGRTRTLRITTVDVSMSIAFTLGSYLSSLIVSSSDISYWISLGFAALGLIYVIIFIKTTRSPPPPPLPLDGEPTKLTTIDQTSVWQKIRAFGRIQLVLEAFRCAIKRRERHTRAVLWVIIAMLTISVVSFTFEMNILLPFLTGAPMHWTTAYMAKFRAVFGVPNIIVFGAGTFFLRRVLKVDDVALILIGTISHIVKSYVISIAQHTYVMYIANVLGLAGMMSMVGTRSILSGLVPRAEQGKVFSCTSVVESICPMLAAVAANKIFAASVEWWPGLFAAITAALGCITLMLLVVADHFILADKVADRWDELESCKVDATRKSVDVSVIKT